ncbi:MAG: PPOX class F420-dependent oxidoreductase [Dermatophilaceae bacterium]
MTGSDDAGSDGAGSGGTGRRHPLADEKFVSLTTFRRTGAAVSSPVWVAPDRLDPRRLVVITVDDTGKTMRLRHTARVELRPCDVKGRVADGAPTYRGTAEVVRSPDEVRAVRRAVNAKYGLPARLLDIGTAALRRVGISRRPRAGIHIAPELEPTCRP